LTEHLKLEFDIQVYSIEAAQKAAYRLLNYFTIDIQPKADQIICTLSSNQGITKEGFDFAIQEFKKNILDEELRLKIRKETEPIRNLVLGVAFSRTGLQQDE
jgi:His-Xaa-Ser system protein HxsD